jgi:hypothetical protein
MPKTKPLADMIEEYGPASIAGIGHNQPPVEPSEFDKLASRLNDLWNDAKDYLDGAAVTTKGMAEDVANIKDLTLEVETKLKALRAEESKPHNDALTEIAARYNPLIADLKGVTGKSVKIKRTAKAALEAYLDALEAEKERIAREAREAADRAAQEAQEALRASSPDNLVEREAAEQLLTDAKHLAADASRAEKDKATIGGTFGRATSRITVYSIEIVDPIKFGGWLWKNRNAQYLEWMQVVADGLVRFGDHAEDEFPGCVVKSERRVR